MAEEGFEVGAVPPYPLVRLVMRRSEEDEGSFEGLVDGELVVQGASVDEVRSVLIARAAERAVSRPGMRPAIRVVGEDEDGDTFELVVTGDGEVFERPSATERAVGAQSGSKRRVVAVGLLLTGLLGAGVGTGAAIVLSGGDEKSASAPVIASPAAPSPTPTQVPVPGAPGWAQQAVWSVPVGGGASASADTAGVATDGRFVFAPADGGKPAVAAYDARNGQRKWRAAVDQSLTTGPFVTKVEGAPAVVAASSSRLYAWTPGGREIGSWKLASSQKVVSTPTGPVVTAQGSQHAQIVVGGKLATRVLPAASTAVAPGQGGVLVAAGGAGQVWSVASADVAGAAVNLEAPAKTEFKTVVAASSRVVVAAFAPKGDDAAGKVVLRAFTVGSWKPTWTSSPVPDSSEQAMVSPDGGWGVFGSSVVDLGSGKVVGLPQDWRTTSVNDEVGFGVTGSQVRAVTKAGLGAGVGQSSQQDAVVAQQAPQAAAGTTAFLVAGDGDGVHLYAVPLVTPAATSPSPSSSSSSSSKKSSAKSSSPSSSKKSSSSVKRGK